MAVLKHSEKPYDNLELVGLAGDWHGNGLWARDKISDLAAAGVKLVIQAGDFGFRSGTLGKRYLQLLDAALAEHSMEMYVVLGNHEDWGRAEQLWQNKKRIDKDGNRLPIQITERIQLHPRGWTFNLGGLKFMSFAGAASINFQDLTRGYDWFPEELPTWDDVSFAEARGLVDVLVGHESVNAEYAPGSVASILSTNPAGWDQTALSYSAVSRNRLTKLFESVQPLLYVHGHIHVYGSGQSQIPGAPHPTRVLCLNKDLAQGNIMVLNLAALKQVKETGEPRRYLFSDRELRG